MIMIYDVFYVKITLEVKTGGYDAKRTKVHMNVAIKLHRTGTCKTKNARVIIMSNDFFACEK